jgi:hypothetical protein
MTHVEAKRIWDYAGGQFKLTPEELAHVSSCDACQRLFRICVHVVNPPKPRPPEEKDRKTA